MSSRRNRMWWWISLVAAVILVIASISSAIATVTSVQAKHSVDSIDVVRASAPAIDVSLATPTPSATETLPATAPATSDSALVSSFSSMLAELPVDDAPSSHAGYDRDLFNIWVDADGDGCNTRAEVLMAETLTAVVTRGRCTVTTGSWLSVYDNATSTLASDMDIDHFVPLNEAWQSGAYAWDSQTRTHFGNDTDYSVSLVVVSASSNRSKSDSDPARWMPSRHDYFCDYAASWVGVKWRWGLSVDTVELRALESVLATCSTIDVEVPERAVVALGAPVDLAPAPVPAADNGVTDPDYGTCALVQANGAGPYVQGVDPEYSWYRDGDKDGTVCE